VTDLDLREAMKTPLHEALHSLDVRITDLTAGDCHCNLVAEVALDVVAPIALARIAELEARAKGIHISCPGEAEIAAAERRGYERAVTRLRDRDAFHAWRHPDPAPWQRKPEPREPNVLAADYLDAVKESTDG
jgi:hypothetical protein